MRTGVVTTAAGLLVLLALDVPSDLRALGPSAFVRLPLEALVYLAVVVALPSRLGRLRVAWACAAGVLLAVTAVFRLLDLGFLAALGRRFDVLVDWRYTRPLVSLLRSSFGDRLGVALAVVAALLLLLVLAVLPWAVLRLTRTAAHHRRGAVRVLALGVALWVGLAVLDVRGTGGAVAAHDNAPYVLRELTRIPVEVRDQRAFADAAQADPRPVPRRGLLRGLRGKDVLFVFVESYGRVAVEGSWFAPGVDAVLARTQRRLDAAGFASRSAWFTSPTFGGISWLAHSTLQSGLWVDSQQRYDVLVGSSRTTLSRLFGRAGWRTVDVVPSNDRDWPQGAFYHYDHVYDSRNIGYQGPRFGYPTMPDQFTLEALYQHELAPRHRRPVMAEVDLLSSHTPWTRTPRLVPQAAVGDGSVYDGMPATLPSQTDVWTSARRVQQAYGHSVQYSLEALTRFLLHHADDHTVVFFLGDHQPATVVSGAGAGHDVPVAVVAEDRRVVDRIASWGWTPGVRPGQESPVWRMDRFRDRFLDAYAAPLGGGDR